MKEEVGEKSLKERDEGEKVGGKRWGRGGRTG